MRAIYPFALALIWLVSGCAAGKKQVDEGERMAAEEKAPQPEKVAEKKEGTPEVEARLGRFIEEHVALMAPREKAMALAYWDATTTGNEKSYKLVSQLELDIRKIYSSPEKFKTISEIRQGGLVKDPLLRRQLEILYLDFQENQLDPVLLEKMVRLSMEIQKLFNDYRGTVGGKQVSDNDIFDILKSSKDSRKRKEAWDTYKARGALVRDKVLELVGLRNQAAKQLGFDNFYEMRLKLIEQDPAEIQRMFDELAQQTDQPFKQLMDEVNVKLSKRYKIKPDQMRPWHYEDPFFQEAPAIGKLDLDPFFRGKDLKALVTEFFKGVDIDPSDILERSDLYEKKGKMPHAYCTDIDRSGDVRILANLRDNEKQTSTLLHEMGHAVYDKYIDVSLPWLLREPSHSFTTEAVAMFFGRLTRESIWLKKMLKLSDKQIGRYQEDIRAQQRLQMLVFARWDMVVTHFERELYSNPGQDLNKLWWDLKERYQLVKRPEGRNAPDWASKIHIASWPAYYHNYLLGEMMASQLLHHVATKEIQAADLGAVDLIGQKKVGSFMKEKIFKPGKSLRWDQLLIQATGETLNPKYFADQFVK